MQRRIVMSLAVLTVWCGAGLNRVGAQFGTLGQPPTRRPAISPYINLGEGGNAFNYYGLVKPQIDANRQINTLQQNMQLLNPDGSARGLLNQQTQAAALTGLDTGHAATFFYYGRYYPQNPYLGTFNQNIGGMGNGMGNGLGGFGGGANTGLGGNQGFGVGGGGVGGGVGGGTGTTFFGPTFNSNFGMRR